MATAPRESLRAAAVPTYRTLPITDRPPPPSAGGVQTGGGLEPDLNRPWLRTLRPGNLGTYATFDPSGDTMSTEPFESDVPAQPRDRREHGGASSRPDDDE